MHILLVEDHPIFRFGVCQLIAQRYPNVSITEASTLADAIAVCKHQTWDVVITDLNFPDATGVEAVPQLIRHAPNSPLLVLSFNDETAYAQRVLAMGASGYIAKDLAGEHMIKAIERVLAGGRYISPALAEQLADMVAGHQQLAPHLSLSSQEYRVMLQLAAGERVIDIAASMHLSAKTISTYRGRILEKLNLNSNLALTQYCAMHGLIEKTK